MSVAISAEVCLFFFGIQISFVVICAMADPSALPQQPAARRRASVKRPPRVEDPPRGRWREEPELDLQKWRTVGENEQDEMIDFMKHEKTFGSLKPRANWDLLAINRQRKIANLARTRSWKKACEDNMARFDDKSWELSGRSADASEFCLHPAVFSSPRQERDRASLQTHSSGSVVADICLTN